MTPRVVMVSADEDMTLEEFLEILSVLAINFFIITPEPSLHAYRRNPEAA